MVGNAIILAAGCGTRLKPITDHAPKCLTEVNNKPIIKNALGALLSCGIKRCTIVTGYMSGSVERWVGAVHGGAAHEGMRIDYVLNEKYKDTNDMYSLWLAREVLERGAVLFEGDVFFRHHVLIEADKAMGSKSYYFAGLYNGRENEVIVETSDERRVLSIEVLRGGRSGTAGKNRFMSSGFLVVQEALGIRFSRWLSEYVSREEVNVLFDDVLSAHVRESELFLYEIPHSDWVEIDTSQDLKRAEEIFR